MQNISKIYQITQDNKSFSIKNQKCVCILLKNSMIERSELSNYLWIKIPFDIFKSITFRRKNLSTFINGIREENLNIRNTLKSLFKINGLLLFLIMSWCIDAEKKMLVFFLKSIYTLSKVTLKTRVLESVIIACERVLNEIQLLLMNQLNIPFQHLP